MEEQLPTIPQDTYNATPVVGDIDIISIGKRIKQIYPDYNDMTDEQAGLGYVSKYGSNENALKAIGVEVKPADVLKKERAKADAEKVLKVLEDNYLGAYKGEGLAYGRIKGIEEDANARLGKNPQLSTYNGLRDSIRPMFARAAGDVGNLSEPEQKAAIKNLPTGASTPEEAILFFIDMRDKFGLAQRNLLQEFPTFAQKVDQEKLIRAEPYYQKLSQGTIDEKEYENAVKKDFPVSVKSDQLPPPIDKIPQKSDFVEKTLPKIGLATAAGLSLLPPIGPLAPLKGLGTIGRLVLAGGIAGGTQPAKNLEERLTQTGIGAALGGIAGKIPRFLFPARVGKTIRAEAIKTAQETGKQIEGNKLRQGIQEWAITARQANPGKGSQVTKIVNEATKQYKNKMITPQQAKNIWDEVNSGFTQSGITKTTVESSADRALRDLLRRKLDIAAPGFEKGTKLIHEGLERGQFLKKAIWPAAIGAGISAGIGIPLYRLLGQRE